MTGSSTQPVARWRIRLFGMLEVTDPEGNVIPVSGKKTGELLAYLALNSGQSHSREKLLDLVWGDSEVMDVRTRLRQEIAKLRTIFEATPNIPSPLSIINNTCQLSGPIEVDAVTFRELVSQAAKLTDLKTRGQLLAKATEMVVGPLMPGYDAAWILNDRAALGQVYIDSLLNLAETLQALGSLPESEQALLKLLSYDRACEPAHIALMRLYAELGQPRRVQDQEAALSAALEKMGGLKPTRSTSLLAESLYVLARQRATQPDSAPMGSLSPPSPDVVLPSKSAPSEPALQVAVASSPSVKRSMLLNHVSTIPTALIILLLITFGFSRWHHLPGNSSRLGTKQPDAMPLRFTYTYVSAPGEKQNSEAKAVVTDGTGIFVTGLIDTDHEDTDVLTIKLSSSGKQLWVDRYSGPEHDCDRAFSICQDGVGGVYVAGESYIGEGSSLKEGWHLLLIHYNRNLQRLWVRRSREVVKNEADCIKVCSSPERGCYVGGTALNGNKRAALILRYDYSGAELWKKQINAGTETTFVSLAPGREGSVYLCGTAIMKSRQTDMDTDWVVSRIDSNGKIVWTDCLDGTAHSADAPRTIAIDSGGNVIVAGVFQVVEPGINRSKKLQLAVQKYTPEGLRIWQRPVTGARPSILMCALSINGASDIAVGVTEQQTNGESDILVVRFDRFGNLANQFNCQVPITMRSAYLSNIMLDRDDQVLMAGEVGPASVASIFDESRTFVSSYSPAGQLRSEAFFGPASQTTNYVRSMDCDSYPVLVGQTGRVNGPHTLMVLSYQK